MRSMVEIYNEFAIISMGNANRELALSIAQSHSVRSFDCASHRNYCKSTADLNH